MKGSEAGTKIANSGAPLEQKKRARFHQRALSQYGLSDL
jgi:hypothetical protein